MPSFHNNNIRKYRTILTESTSINLRESSANRLSLLDSEHTSDVFDFDDDSMNIISSVYMSKTRRLSELRSKNRETAPYKTYVYDQSIITTNCRWSITDSQHSIRVCMSYAITCQPPHDCICTNLYVN